MKKTILFLSAVIAFSCESECIVCHPKLKNLYNPNNKYYKEHVFLKDCTKCHKSHPAKGEDKCGADCFDCHSREKLINTPIPDHQKLKNCTKCHKSQKVLEELKPKNENWLNLP